MVRDTDWCEIRIAARYYRFTLKLLPGTLRTALCCLLLFGLSAWVCLGLWTAGYIDELGSSEGPFLAFSLWITRHWGDLRWFPLWFSGMPFERVYGPGLHWTVAFVASASHIPVLRSYRLITTSFYCLGPVTLFWLCYRLIGSRGFALAAGAVYVLFSPAALLSTVIRTDLGSYFWPRRYQSLVEYGESPHIVGLTLAPLVVWSFHEAVGQGRRRFIPLTAVLLGVVIATNWTATVGLSMALAAYAISRIGDVPRVRWIWAAAIVVLGYLLVCPLVPPSILAAVPGNASDSDGTRFSLAQCVSLILLASTLAVLHFLSERRGVRRGFRFFAYFFAISAFVTLSRFWFDVYMMPQPHRFQLEMEMAFVPLCLLAFYARWHKWPAVVALAVFRAFQLREYRAGVAFFTRPVKMENTIEYRATEWLALQCAW